MPPKSQQPPSLPQQISSSPNPQGNSSSLRRVSDVSTAQSDSTRSESDGLDLRTALEKFLNEIADQNQSPDPNLAKNTRKKRVRKLMKRVSDKLPKDFCGPDRNLCIKTIQVFLERGNPKAMEFYSLIETESFSDLLLRVCCFSRIASKEVLMDPEALKMHDSCDAGTFLSQLKDITSVEPLNFPTSEEYNVMLKLMHKFNDGFDQTSEQSAVMKVAAFKVLVHLNNEHLCTKYFPELSLFTIDQKECAAEVIARVNMKHYRYFLTGKADGFIASLTIEEGTSWHILNNERARDEFSKRACDGLVAPKYRALDSNLQNILGVLGDDHADADQRLLYEIVVLEVKKLQFPTKTRGDELKSHLKQVIGECAAIHEYGRDQSKFVKFILSDGERWLFGILRNPVIHAVGADTGRECFYATLDNSSHDLGSIKQTTELLAFWMTIPGTILYDCFLKYEKKQ